MNQVAQLHPAVSSKESSAIRVYLKDGHTVYEFDDASKLRRLLHDGPGYKPPNRNGADEALDAIQVHRVRDARGQLTGEFGARTPVRLRFVAKQSISCVEEVVEGA